jgi:hypothetical protein
MLSEDEAERIMESGINIIFRLMLFFQFFTLAVRIDIEVIYLLRPLSLVLQG